MKKFLLLLSGLLLAAGATAQPAQGEVRNIIYLIGDGMGLSHRSEERRVGKECRL